VSRSRCKERGFPALDHSLTNGATLGPQQPPLVSGIELNQRQYTASDVFRDCYVRNPCSLIQARAAGADFTGQELQELERTARRVATLGPEILFTDTNQLRCRLELQKEDKKKPKKAHRH
jgi:hypothetical protein